MICRKCGSVLEKGIKVCPFCEEMAESDADNLMPQTREEKDSRAIGDGMPPLVRLKELAAIPEEQDRLMDELHRLHDYFEQIKGKYGVLGDLWLMQAQYKEPLLGHWIWGGGLLTLFIYMIMSGVVSGRVSTFFSCCGCWLQRLDTFGPGGAISTAKLNWMQISARLRMKCASGTIRLSIVSCRWITQIRG